MLNQKSVMVSLSNRENIIDTTYFDKFRMTSMILDTFDSASGGTTT
jgi:hypothetical protein